MWEAQRPMECVIQRCVSLLFDIGKDMENALDTQEQLSQSLSQMERACVDQKTLFWQREDSTQENQKNFMILLNKEV